jgi:hypothetical protein
MQPNPPMKSEDKIIWGLLAALILICAFSYWRVPAYPDNARLIAEALVTSFGTVCGYKFGKNMPAQATDPRVGQSSTSEVTTKAEAEPPAGKA